MYEFVHNFTYRLHLHNMHVGYMFLNFLTIFIILSAQLSLFGNVINYMKSIRCEF